MTGLLLDVQHLVTRFHTRNGMARAVDDVSFTVCAGETLALVGESGCGKSVSALSVMRLVDDPPGRIEAGRILWRGKDLLQLGAEAMRRVRGEDIAMIFQDPMTSLNPVLTCGFQITEAVRLHQKVDRREARRRAVGMLERVGIAAPEERANEYPHQLSGGMRQRVMIAMALSCNPDLLIADEPTTALDVTVQAQILDLLHDLQQEYHLAMLLITHDLGVVADAADRVAVMYAGQIVESAATKVVLATPQHPYTRALLRSVPHLEGDRDRLEPISGMVPEAWNMPAGCRFAPRCPLADDRCSESEPPLELKEPGHLARCWKAVI